MPFARLRPGRTRHRFRSITESDMLRAAGVSFTYRRDRGSTKVRAGPHAQTDGVWNDVLKDVSLDVERGDLVGILGPNGSGKTTLLKLLGGVYRPRRPAR